MTTLHAVPSKALTGWCSRRLGDAYAPNDHDGSNLHARTGECLNFVTTAPEPDEVVETVDCSYCDTPIVPEVEDFDTALCCSCGDWHHYDCASSCAEYVDNLRQAALEDRARDEWACDLR